MRILLLYSHHRRTLNVYYKRALVRLGHQVVSVGPWDEQQRFGTHGRTPDVMLPAAVPPWYAYEQIAAHLPWTPDLVWLLEGGEDLRVLNVPREIPFVHQSVEGSHMEWSRGITPHRYVNFTCNGFAPPDVKWLPYGFDEVEAGPYNVPTADREYDCAQIGSARESRVLVWEHLRKATDVHCWFSGDLWGPAHFALYRNARSTFVNQTISFCCPRVFDAMGMGCLLLSDRVPAVTELFNDEEHFLGYDRVFGRDGEGIPHPDWILDIVRRCRREPQWAQGIALAGRRLAWEKHTYRHRVEEVLNDVQRS